MKSKGQILIHGRSQMNSGTRNFNSFSLQHEYVVLLLLTGILHTCGHAIVAALKQRLTVILRHHTLLCTGHQQQVVQYCRVLCVLSHYSLHCRRPCCLINPHRCSTSVKRHILHCHPPPTLCQPVNPCLRPICTCDVDYTMEGQHTAVKPPCAEKTVKKQKRGEANIKLKGNQT